MDLTPADRAALTARLHLAVAKAYYGYRIWARGGEHATPEIEGIVREGLAGIQQVAAQIRDYPVKPASGQWVWVEDADKALEYHEWITAGWPAETRGFRNPYGGKAFPE